MLQVGFYTFRMFTQLGSCSLCLWCSCFATNHFWTLFIKCLELLASFWADKMPSGCTFTWKRNNKLLSLLVMFCFYFYFRVAVGLRNFQLPTLCLPFLLFVVLFIEPFCHFEGGTKLQQQVVPFVFGFLHPTVEIWFFTQSDFYVLDLIAWHSSTIAAKRGFRFCPSVLHVSFVVFSLRFDWCHFYFHVFGVLIWFCVSPFGSGKVGWKGQSSLTFFLLSVGASSSSKTNTRVFVAFQPSSTWMWCEASIFTCSVWNFDEFGLKNMSSWKTCVGKCLKNISFARWRPLRHLACLWGSGTESLLSPNCPAAASAQEAPFSPWWCMYHLLLWSWTSA